LNSWFDPFELKFCFSRSPNQAIAALVQQEPPYQLLSSRAIPT
jgi:hypothetical protein